MDKGQRLKMAIYTILLVSTIWSCGPTRDIQLMSVESVTYDTTFIRGDTIIQHRHKIADKPMDRKLLWIAVGGIVLLIIVRIFIH